MTTYFFGANNVVLTLCLCLLVSCQSEEFYEKEYLENPFKTATGVPGADGGTTTSGTTVGGTDGGSTVGGTTTSGSTVGGTTTSGSTTGTTTSGSTVGGTTTSGSTTGGVGYEDREEIFTQKAEKLNKLDILWVIDSSGSMGDDQAALARNFDAFISDFITKDVDFKMAITTTDDRNSYQGIMVPGSDTKLTSTAAHSNSTKFMDDFKSLIQVGISGSGNEQGLAGADRFKTRYPSFFREEAYLAIVIVSDEEDSSPSTVESYVASLQQVKNNPGFVKIYSIVDLDNSNRGGGIKVGSLRYQKASELTSGTKADIDDNFYSTLLGMGEVIINLLDSFALAATPVAGTLKVYVNNVEVLSGHSYDAQSNSIKFDEHSLPPADAKIKVTYQVPK